MKKIFACFLSLVFTLTVFAQTELSVSICESNENIIINEKTITSSIEYDNLLDCHELSVSKKNWKVSNFNFSISVNEDGTKVQNDKAGNMVIEIIVKDNKFNDEVIKLIKTHQPKKIFVEDINLINLDGETAKIKPLIISINY